MSKHRHREQDHHREQIRRSDADRLRRKDIRRPERMNTVAADEETYQQGSVIASESAYFIVRLDNGNEVRARTIKSTVSGNPNATLVATGDRVSVEVTDGDAIIRSVAERSTKLARKAHKRKDNFEQVIAANVDRLLIVSSVLEPSFLTSLIDRYIVAGLEGGLGIVIIVNKKDLLSEDPKKDFILEALDHYRSLGYQVFLTSGENGDGIAELKYSLAGHISVLAGRSGVGKSSIVNALVGENIARISDLTRKERRGAHTTTNAVLIPIPDVENAYVIDTPGVREFFNHAPDEENLKFHFVEFLPYQEQCAMRNCTHTHEADCAVRHAVEEGEIPHWRYNCYSALYEEALAERDKLYS
jgi:ribosome biogenesis GTPase